MKELSINVIIVGDSNVEMATHVTLFSILENSTYDFHNVYYVTKECDKKAENDLSKTLVSFKDRYTLHIIEFDNIAFNNLKGLHGNTFTYAKLALANVVKCDAALYIDIDVVVQLDIKEFEQYFKVLDKYTIMANQEATLYTSNEKELYKKKLKLNDGKYFNAGVMIINLEKWRKDKLFEKFLKFAIDNNSFLKAADQTVLNGVLSEDKIGCLPEKFNLRVENYLSKNTYLNRNAILHFYGRPKPWDLLGEYVHPHHKIFKNILRKTYFNNYHSVLSMNEKSIRTAFRTYKSYVKVILRIKV